MPPRSQHVFGGAELRFLRGGARICYTNEQFFLEGSMARREDGGKETMAARAPARRALACLPACLHECMHEMNE